MPGSLGPTVALEITDWVGDTEVGHCVISVGVQDGYSPDEGRDCDMGVGAVDSFTDARVSGSDGRARDH
jgi:hypothetical protein